MKREIEHPWYLALRNGGLFVVAASLLAFSPLAAQEEATEGEEETDLAEEETDVVELPEFRVDESREYGYRGTSSHTAIRLASQSVDLPMNISILPEEFIEDLAFDTPQEVARYVSGALADERVSSFTGGHVYVRAFRVNQRRNGLTLGTFEATNLNAVDRVEVIKGPIGVFYGNASPGGVFNVVTKKPQFRNGGSVAYTYGSYNHHRVAIDAQAKAMNNTLGVRLNGTYINSEDWRDFEKMEEEYLTGAIRWNPKPRFDVFYEYEHAQARRNDGANDLVGNPMLQEEYANIPQNIVDYFRNKRDDPDDQTTINYLRDRWIAGPSAGVVRWADDHREATGEYVFVRAGFDDPFRISPRGNFFNRNGTGAFFDYISKSHHFNVTWGPTEWIDVRYQYYDIETELNEVLNFLTDALADYTLYMRDNFNHRNRERRINQQVDVKFRFKTEKAGNHTLIYGHENRHNFRWRRGSHRFDWDLLPDLEVVADPYFKGGPVAPGTPMITVKGSEYRKRWNPYIHEVPSYTDAITTLIETTPQSPTWLTGHYFTHLGSFFNNRARTMVGVRFEEEDDGDTGTTPRYGAVIEVLPGWHIFGSYSERWAPNRENITGRGVTAEDNQFKFANQTGNGIDIGIKTNWKDHKLDGTISWFTLERANIRQQDGRRNDTDPRNTDDTPENNVVWYLLSGLERVKGVETDLVWTPNQNFQMLFTYGWFYDAKIVSDTSLTIPFEVEFQNGRQLHNAPKHNLAVWGKYKLTEGKLRGLSFGLGVRATSEAEVSNNKPFRTHFNPGYSVWDGLIQYETDKIGKRTVFSLNLENMFDQTWHTGLAVGDPLKVYFKVKTFF